MRVKREGVKMKLEKGYLLKSVIFMLTLLIFLPGALGIKEEAASYSGVIKSVDKDFKFIVVNDVKVLISEGTTVVDEKGKILRMNDLKPGLSVAIEGGRRSDGFFARKIIITTPKKKP
jgi:hypothetical protein